MLEEEDNVLPDIYKFIVKIMFLLLKDNKISDEDYKNIVSDTKKKIKNKSSVFKFLINNSIIFCKIKYNNILRICNEINIELPRDLHDIDNFCPNIIRVPNYILENINNELITKTKSIGILSSIDNKENKKIFINTFIYSCINMFQGEVIDEMEKYYNININEYFLTSYSRITIVILISDKDIEYQYNYGKIIVLLYISYLYNNNNNVTINNIYGIVTSGSNWQWFKYDGKKIYASNKITELRKRNPKSLPIIISYIYSILIDSWIESFNLNFGKYINNKHYSLIEKINICKIDIYNSKNNDESVKAFDKLKNIISEIKSINGEKYWDYDINYLIN